LTVIVFVPVNAVLTAPTAVHTVAELGYDWTRVTL
jgi:hypothetical protein